LLLDVKQSINQNYCSFIFNHISCHLILSNLCICILINMLIAVPFLLLHLTGITGISPDQC
jgi:hypothetical protein